MPIPHEVWDAVGETLRRFCGKYELSVNGQENQNNVTSIAIYMILYIGLSILLFESPLAGRIPVNYHDCIGALN